MITNTTDRAYIIYLQLQHRQSAAACGFWTYHLCDCTHCYRLPVPTSPASHTEPSNLRQLVSPLCTEASLRAAEKICNQEREPSGPHEVPGHWGRGTAQTWSNLPSLQHWYCGRWHTETLPEETQIDVNNSNWVIFAGQLLCKLPWFCGDDIRRQIAGEMMVTALHNKYQPQTKTFKNSLFKEASFLGQ